MIMHGLYNDGILSILLSFLTINIGVDLGEY